MVGNLPLYELELNFFPVYNRATDLQQKDSGHKQTNGRLLLKADSIDIDTNLKLKYSFRSLTLPTTHSTSTSELLYIGRRLRKDHFFELQQ